MPANSQLRAAKLACQQHYENPQPGSGRGEKAVRGGCLDVRIYAPFTRVFSGGFTRASSCSGGAFASSSSPPPVLPFPSISCKDHHHKSSCHDGGGDDGDRCYSDGVVVVAVKVISGTTIKLRT
jgi:hypothetical protein